MPVGGFIVISLFSRIVKDLLLVQSDGFAGGAMPSLTLTISQTKL